MEGVDPRGLTVGRFIMLVVAIPGEMSNPQSEYKPGMDQVP